MLTHDNPRVWALGEVNSFVLAPNTTLFRGAAVGDNGSGLARPLQAGDQFLGFCEAFVSNLPPSPAVPAAQGGDDRVRVLTSGRVQLEVAGVKVGSLGATVYAVDDDNFTLSGCPNSPFGTVYRVVREGIAVVAFGHQSAPRLPSHSVVAAGTHKTTGGHALEKIALPGLRVTDMVHVSLASPGKTPRTVQHSIALLNSLQVTFNDDPGADHVVQYVVYRALG